MEIFEPFKPSRGYTAKMNLRCFCCAALALAMLSCGVKSEAPVTQAPSPTPPPPGYYAKLYPTSRAGIWHTKSGQEIDLRGFKSGMEVRDPYSKEIYLVP